MSLLKTLLSLPLLAVLTDGQALFNGTCPQRQPVENISFLSTLDGWFEYAKYLDGESSFKCITQYFFRLNTSEERTFFINHKALPVSGTHFNLTTFSAHFLPDTTVGTYEVVPYPNPNGTCPTEYNILHIEYNKTAFIWRCEEGVDEQTDQPVNLQYLGIWTRDQLPGREHRASIEQTAAKLHLSLYRLKKIDQTDCEEGHQ